MLNIVIPMAGLGSRFSKAGFALPKPLIPVRGRPMIEWVIDNICPTQTHRLIFICQREHLEHYDLASLLLATGRNTKIVSIEHITEGAACTVLLAKQLINNEIPLMIANCDQYVDVSIDEYLMGMRQGGFDGYMMTMTASDPKWSFVRLDEKDAVVEVVEKEVVSSEATVGIYNYARGSDFIEAAELMISENNKTNNEFYVAPVYNYMIRAGLKVGYKNIGSERCGMYGLGVPEDLKYFNGLSMDPASVNAHVK